jgi:hypothetical protein
MYSVSSVNEGKYRTVSDSIKAALNPVNSIPSSRLPFSIGDTKPKMIPPECPSSVNDPVIRRMREIVIQDQSSPQRGHRRDQNHRNRPRNHHDFLAGIHSLSKRGGTGAFGGLAVTEIPGSRF